MSADEVNIDTASLEELRDILINKTGNTKLANRFRALFNLKSVEVKIQIKNTKQSNTLLNVSTMILNY